MNCGDVKDLVHAYVDDELDVITAREVDEHLNMCARCRGKLGEVRVVKEAVGGQYFKAPAGLRERVLQGLDEKEGRSSIPLTPIRSRALDNSPALSRSVRGKTGVSAWWRGLAVAAVVAIVGGVIFLNRSSGDDRVVAEVLTAHLRCCRRGI